MEYGNDPSVDAAAAKLLGRFMGANEAVDDPKKRSPELRDLAEEQPLPNDDADINGYEPDEELTEGADALEHETEGEEAQRLQDEFFELPSETEGAEAEKIPRADVIAAVRQMRQLNGGIAEAITKAEVEHHAKQDQAWTQMVQAYNVVIDRAEAALASIPRPQMPPRSMLDENSPNCDPQRYYQLANYYDDQVAVIERVATRKREAEAERAAIANAAQQEYTNREHERMGRYHPDWKDEAKRDELSRGVYGFLEKTYGLKADFLNASIPFDHRIVRAMMDLKAMTEAKAKAPEVRKAVKESVPRLDAKGRVVNQTRDPSNGQFVADAKKRLKTEGSEAAAAAKWLKDGTIRL